MFAKLVHRFEHLKETFKRFLLNISSFLVYFLEEHQKSFSHISFMVGLLSRGGTLER
jgi:hypothetical protein